MHNLDIGYQKASHKTELIVKDEEARRLKLRSQLLRNDNATIKDDLAKKEERIKELVAQHEALQEQLHSASEKARQQENRMRSLERELANLKVGHT
jgi:chromosome segregation ATPase